MTGYCAIKLAYLYHVYSAVAMFDLPLLLLIYRCHVLLIFTLFTLQTPGSTPPKWQAEIEKNDVDMLQGTLTYIA